MNWLSFLLFLLITALLLWRQRSTYQRGYNDALNQVLNGTKHIRLFQPVNPNTPVILNEVKHYYLTDLINELKEIQWLKNRLTR